MYPLNSFKSSLIRHHDEKLLRRLHIYSVRHCGCCPRGGFWGTLGRKYLHGIGGSAALHGYDQIRAFRICTRARHLQIVRVVLGRNATSYAGRWVLNVESERRSSGIVIGIFHGQNVRAAHGQIDSPIIPMRGLCRNYNGLISTGKDRYLVRSCT